MTARATFLRLNRDLNAMVGRGYAGWTFRSVAWPWNAAEAKVVAAWQDVRHCDSAWQYLGHECPSYRNRSYGLKRFRGVSADDDVAVLQHDAQVTAVGVANAFAA